jgi:hypothetical protein
MERNPYLILGIPFGTGREEANAAFVRRARKVRRGELPDLDLTDLTWALNQVDEALDDPLTALGIYRVPAVPAAFAGEGQGVLRPPARPPAARTGDGAQALLLAQRAAAQESLRRLVLLRGSRIGPVYP